jgi:hypothetical protein
MIDLNPLVIARSQCKPPPNASPDEFLAIWYSITDRVTYFPGATGKVTFTGCFHDLPDGLQTHIFAPLGVELRSRWQVGGSLPGEPAVPVELGLDVPRVGLYLREDVEMRCNFLTTPFVKKELLKSHKTLVDRIVEKAKDTSPAQLIDANLAAAARGSPNDISGPSIYGQSHGQSASGPSTQNQYGQTPLAINELPA